MNSKSLGQSLPWRITRNLTTQSHWCLVPQREARSIYRRFSYIIQCSEIPERHVYLDDIRYAIYLLDWYLSTTPDQIIYNTKTNFAATEFKQFVSSISINIKEIPVEVYNSVGLVKRYYAPLRRIYKIIKRELKEIGRASCRERVFLSV